MTMNHRQLVGLPAYLWQDISRYADKHDMTQDELIEIACAQYMTQATLRVSIQDTEAMRAVSAESVTDYLIAHGWIDQGQWADRPADIFTRDVDGREWELVVPRGERLADYGSVIGRIIEELAMVEKRSEIDVYFDIHLRGGRPWLAPHAERI